MPNPFDQFDAAPTSAATANPFDQFDQQQADPEEAAHLANVEAGKKVPDWLLAMTPKSAEPWVREGMGAVANSVPALPGKVWRGVTSAVDRVAHDIVNPEDAVADVKTVAKGAANAVMNPGDTLAGIIHSSSQDPASGALNALTIGSGGNLTLGRGVAQAGTKAADFADAALLRPVNALVSGVSGEGQRLAQKAGELGGAEGRAFRANIAEPDYAGMQATGQKGIKGLKEERGSAYQQGIQDTAASKVRIPYTDITKATQDGRALGLSGKFVKDPSVIEAMDAVDKAIAEHQVIPGTPIRITRQLPLQMDALKQRVGKILAEQPEGSAAQKAVLGVYDTIKGNIVKAVPTYANVMDEYGGASQAINNAVSQLGLGRRATRGSAAGKLMSALRDTGAATQVTKGDALADVARHAPTLPYQIAGASMNPVLPRGIVARGGALLHGLEGIGIAGLLAHLLNPGILIPTLMSSPRLVGNARYGVGAATRGARAVGATQENIGKAVEAARIRGLLDDQQQGPKGLLNP
jgi:hypothetical protein